MECGLGFWNLVHNYGHFITSVLHNFGRALYFRIQSAQPNYKTLYQCKLKCQISTYHFHSYLLPGIFRNNIQVFRNFYISLKYCNIEKILKIS